MNNLVTVLVIVAVGMIAFNQVMVMNIGSGSGNSFATGSFFKLDFASSSSDGKDISNVDLSTIKGTGFAVAALFPVENIKTAEDAIAVMISTGSPPYGDALGITYDDPVGGMNTLYKQFREVPLTEEENDRYIYLSSNPFGISCEFCCGVGPIGADSNGNPRCGCKHNPAILGLTKWLVHNTDWSDQEILKEALKWKALWFPRDMVKLALQTAGGDTSSLDAHIPGMVGGC